MVQPIYKAYIGRYLEAWYQLSKTEQDQLLAKLDKERANVGGKGVIYCDSSWSSDRELLFGVDEFPDLEAVQRYQAFLSEVNWFRYEDSVTVTVLGTKSE